MNPIVRKYLQKQIFTQKGAIGSAKAVQFAYDALETRMKNLGLDINLIKTEKDLNKNPVPTIAVSDYVKMSSEQISPYVSGAYYALGTDGFGRSDTRENLRHFFEVDRYYIVLTAVRALAIEGVLEMSIANKVIKKYNIDSNKPSPITV